jgi:hypothetical protein
MFFVALFFALFLIYRGVVYAASTTMTPSSCGWRNSSITVSVSSTPQQWIYIRNALLSLEHQLIAALLV